MLDEQKKSEVSTSQSSIQRDIVSKEKLLESGIYFGHRKSKWNPKMKPYILTSKKGTHIIDINKTKRTLEFAYSMIKKYAAQDASFIFVGTREQAKKTIKENALRTNSFYVNERWLGGTLTNNKTIFNSVKRMIHLEKLAENNFDGYTKKEGVMFSKDLAKLQKNLMGIRNMVSKPTMMIVADPNVDEIAVKEARKSGVKIIGIADTNTDPNIVDIAIPANDDSAKSVTLVITILADAIASAKGGKELFAYQPDEAIVLPEDVRPPKDDKFDKNRRSSVRRFGPNRFEKQPYNKENKTEGQDSGTQRRTFSKPATTTTSPVATEADKTVTPSASSESVEQQPKAPRAKKVDAPEENSLVKSQAVSAAELVKELRNITGAGFLDCKKALEESNNDLDKAIVILQERGVAKAAKKAGSIAAEGVVNVVSNDNKIVIYEVNSQTDFVANNSEFVSLVDKIGQGLLNGNFTDVEGAKKVSIDGKTIEEICVEAIAKIGENIVLRRVSVINKKPNEAVGCYVHVNKRVAAVVTTSQGQDEIARNVAMHVASMNPQYLNSSAISSEEMAKIKSGIELPADKVNMPENVKEKILEGMIQKKLSELTLVDQEFVMEKGSVSNYISNNGNGQATFMVRFEVGEGIEKPVSNFAEEVAAQMTNK